MAVVKATPAPPAPPSDGEKGASQPPLAARIGLRLASPALSFLESFGEHMMLLGQSFAWLFRRPWLRAGLTLSPLASVQPATSRSSGSIAAVAST